MKKAAALLTCIIIFAALFHASAFAAAAEKKQHPFLLIEQSDFEELRARADKSPWKEMKEDAIKTAQETNYNPASGVSIQQRSNDLNTLMSANSLAYILDPENKHIYINNLMKLVGFWESGTEKNLYDELYQSSSGPWDNTIPPAGAFTSTVLAFDIVYPELTEKQREEAEKIMSAVAGHYGRIMESHQVGVYGVRGLWAAYNGDIEDMKLQMEGWLKYYDAYVTSSGAGTPGMAYALDRFTTATRLSKQILPMLMRSVGNDNEFYEKESNKMFAEWVLGYTYTPFMTQVWCFGDTNTYKYGQGMKTMINGMNFPYRAATVTKTAQQYANWLTDRLEVKPAGRLMNYIFLKEDMTDKKTPESRVFPDGGAWLYENYDNGNSLAGVLWNPEKEDGHGHKETNAINIAAYGKLLMANGGYNGWAASCKGYSWNYINSSALSANTVLINYEPGNVKNPSSQNDHRYKCGAGIDESLISELFGYARGDSGQALPNGKNLRSLSMVSTQDGAPGYFFMLDDVWAENAGDAADIVYRPYSSEYVSEEENGSYKWTVKGQSGSPVGLKIFLSEKADAANMIDGVIADNTYPEEIKSLFAKYYTDSKTGKRRIGTVLMPYKNDTELPEISRFDTDGGHGSRISFANGVNDYIIYNDDNVQKTYYIPQGDSNRAGGYNRLRYAADWMICRQINGTNGFMFAQNAKECLAGEEGFKSDKETVFYKKGDKCIVSCPENVKLTLYYYGLSKVSCEDLTTESNGEFSKGITIELEKGTHTLELEFDENKKTAEIAASKAAHGRFAGMTIIDAESGRSIAGGTECDELKENKPQYYNGSIYVPETFAEKFIGDVECENISINGTAYVPLRRYAEECEKTVLWDNRGFVILANAEIMLSKTQDLPLVGIAAQIIGKQGETFARFMPETASDITIDGTTIKNFDAYTTAYSISKIKGNDLGEIKVYSSGKSEITLPEKYPGDIKISVYNPEDMSTRTNYIISVSEREDNGIKSAYASEEPQPENPADAAIDGDLNTRWSAEGAGCFITFDLGRERDILKMYTAWFSGNTRATKFDVELSSDGEAWTKMFSGSGSGSTSDFEEVPRVSGKARYVKLTGYGNSSNGWNSLSEVKFDFND